LRIRQSIPVAVTLAALLLGATPARADPTLGFVISQLMDQAQQTIEQARNAGLTLEMEAGRQVYLTLGQAQAAYTQSLDHTVDKVDDATRRNIAQLTTAVQGLRNHTFNDLRTLTGQLQVVVQSLPFREHQPQLATVSPHFAVPSLKAPALVFRFSGSFEFAGRQGFIPTLRIGQHTASADTATTQELKFLVPSEVVARLANTSRVVFIKAELTVPWQEKHLLSTERLKDRYPILLGLLPSTPGRITIEQSYPVHEALPKHYKGPNHHLSSQREGGNDDHKDVRSSDVADPGCVINRDSVRLIGSGHGDQSYGLIAIDPSQVISTATTIHHPMGESGVNDYWIEFDEQCPSTRLQKDPPIVVNDGTAANLRWGDQRTYDLQPEAKYKIVFDSFDGQHAEYTRPQNHPQGLLRVGEGARQLELSTADPASLQWP